MRHSHRQSIEFVLICLVSSCLRRNLCKPLLVEYFCVIRISPLLCTVITQLHRGKCVPQSSLSRWACALLTYHTVQIVRLFCDWDVRGSGRRNTLTRTRQKQVRHSGSVNLALIQETHFTGVPQLSGNLSEITGWAVWFDAESAEASTLVSAEKCDGGQLFSPDF